MLRKKLKVYFALSSATKGLALAPPMRHTTHLVMKGSSGKEQFQPKHPTWPLPMAHPKQTISLKPGECQLEDWPILHTS